MPFFFREWQRKNILPLKYQTAGRNFKRVGLHYKDFAAAIGVLGLATTDPAAKIRENRTNVRKSG